MKASSQAPAIYALTVLALLCMAGWAKAQSSLPQPLLYLPFDGSLANQGSFPAAPLAIAPKGDLYEAGATFAEGKIGQSLRLTGDYAVEIPFGLSRSVYPQVTVTAWVYSEPGRNKQQVKLVSNGGYLWLNLYGEGIHLNCGSGCFVRQDNTVSEGQWTFAAGVLDIDSNTMSLTINGLPMSAEMDTSRTNPDRTSVWVGTRKDAEGTFGGSARIDDVRIYGTALSQDQINQLFMQGLTGTAPGESSSGSQARETAGASSEPMLETPTGISQPTGITGPSGTPGQEVGEDVQAAQEAASTRTASVISDPDVLTGQADPVLDPEMAEQGPGEVFERMAGTADTNAGTSGESAGTAAASAESNTATEAERPVIGWYVGSGEDVVSPLAGSSGDVSRILTVREGGGLQAIGWRRNAGKPCRLLVRSNAVDWEAEAGACTFEMSTRQAQLPEAIVTELDFDPKETDALDSLTIRGRRVSASGDFGLEEVDSSADVDINIEPVSYITSCPNNRVATGVVGHFRRGSAQTTIVGLQLICNPIIKVYE